MRTRRLSKAFTLVEILIVVVILGILAAIVVPQFTNAANDARDGNIATQESTLQNQVELFQAREGAYPDFDADGWDTMIAGGYIKEAPVNPYNGLSAVGAAGDDDIGWEWDGDTITAVVP